ncbi:MAG: hypothetical protein ABWX67_12395 [Allosphingosinicella sp.]
MRLILTTAVATLALSGLAACGQGDDAFRTSYRTKAVEACVQGGQRSPGAGSVDTSRFCNCMVDGYMRETSSEQLKAERNQSSPPPAAQRAMAQCLQQQLGATPGATPPAPAGNTAE